jgi:hypothetical protein
MVLALPLIEVAILLFAALVALWEGSAWFFGRRAPRRASDADGDRQGYIVSGVLGLLALLLAFAFSLALERHEERRRLVVVEANAIGSFSQRLSVLDPPARDAIGRGLKAYGSTRATLGRTVPRADRLRLMARGDGQLAAINRATLAALDPVRTSAGASLVIQGLNAVNDVAAERQAANEARLPPRVLAVLILYCAVTSVMLGYAVAAGRDRHRVAAWLLFALLTLAFTTILDLDRPRSGAILVPIEPLERAVAALP